MHHAFALTYTWMAARADEHVVYGPRFAVYSAVVQLPDGAGPALDVSASLRENANVIDRLCRLALDTYEAWRRAPDAAREPRGRAPALPRSSYWGIMSQSQQTRPATRAVPDSTGYDRVERRGSAADDRARAHRRDAGVQRGRDPRVVGDGGRATACAPAASRSRSSSSRTARPTAPPRSPTRSPRRSPKCASSTAPTPTTAARCAPGCSSAQRRRGRQLRHRLLRPRLPRRRGRPRARARRSGRSSSARSAAKAPPTSAPRCASSRPRCSARCCASASACTSPTRTASRRCAAPRSSRSPARAVPGQDLFDTELILRVERAGLRTAEIPVGVTELRPARTSIMKRVPRTLLGLVKLRIALFRDRHG